MSKISVAELDFAKIKQTLRDYFRADTTFTDFDFEGAGLSYLLNVLAANNTNIAFYLNMVANEMFLDSAVLRNNVVARAKALGYTPRSTKASKAVLNVVFSVSGSPASITIPRGTKFSTTISSRNYNFIVMDAVVVYRSNAGTYEINGLEIFEGNLLTHKYTVNLLDETQKFLIPNTSVDTDHIVVSVQNSATDTGTFVYNKADNLTDVTGEDKIYWLSEVDEGEYEVTFGDDTVGKALVNDNIVIIQYLKTVAEVANSASTFSLSSVITDVNSASITLVSKSSGGSQPEDLDSIKFLAPLFYEAQGRAVTKTDYEILIKRDYPYVQSVRVWGGEDNDPPEYGKVFVSLMPTEGFIISSTTKNYIINTIIKPRNILPIQVEIVDPDYLYLDVSTVVKYSPARTTLTSGEMVSLVSGRVTDYFTSQLNSFESKFRFSTLATWIDDSEASINNNQTVILMKYRLFPTLNVPTQYTINLNNAVDRGDFLNEDFGVYSEAFTYLGYTCYISDNGQGDLQIYRLVSGERIVVVANAGTIDYSTGKIILNLFSPSAITSGNNFITFTAKPENDDLVSLRNQIITVLESSIHISTETE